MTMIDINIVLVLMILGAVIAVEARCLLSAIVAVGAVGLMLSLAFLMLKAPDLAIVQLVVEILALIILLRATVGREAATREEGFRFIPFFVGIILVVPVIVSACLAVLKVPPFGEPLMNVARTYIAEGLAKTGAANLVSSVILDFRAYDTLGEVVVLFTAIVGVLAVVRGIGRKQKTERPGAK
jgi:multicomponent Na+:H+ antiporter subunit B